MSTEKQRAYQREYYKKHRDQYVEYYKKNRAKHDAQTKEWQSKHPEKMVANWHRCYAKKLARMTDAKMNTLGNKCWCSNCGALYSAANEKTYPHLYCRSCGVWLGERTDK